LIEKPHTSNDLNHTHTHTTPQSNQNTKEHIEKMKNKYRNMKKIRYETIPTVENVMKNEKMTAKKST